MSLTDAYVRQATPSDHAPCSAIGYALPEYFSRDGLLQMERDLATHETWVVDSSGRIDGFANCARKSVTVVEIRWLAVRPAEQNKGFGSQLLHTIAAHYQQDGVVVMMVKTLAATVESPRYARTRDFYEKRGFVLVEVVEPFPTWGPGNPCAIYIRPLASSN